MDVKRNVERWDEQKRLEKKGEIRSVMNEVEREEGRGRGERTGGRGRVREIMMASGEIV